MEQLMAGTQAEPKILVSQCHITFVEDTDILVDGAAPHRMRAYQTTPSQIAIAIRRPLPGPLALMLFKGLVWNSRQVRIAIDQRHIRMCIECSCQDLVRIGTEPVVCTERSHIRAGRKLQGHIPGGIHTDTLRGAEIQNIVVSLLECLDDKSFILRG